MDLVGKLRFHYDMKVRPRINPDLRRLNALAQRPLPFEPLDVGLLPALEVRHDLGSGRTEWFGSAALTVTVWRVWLTMSVGYGLSVVGDGAPRHLFDTTGGLAMKFGNVWVGLSVDSAMRVGTTGRTLQVLSTLGWEFALPDA